MSDDPTTETTEKAPKPKRKPKPRPYKSIGYWLDSIAPEGRLAYLKAPLLDAAGYVSGLRYPVPAGGIPANLAEHTEVVELLAQVPVTHRRGAAEILARSVDAVSEGGSNSRLYFKACREVERVLGPEVRDLVLEAEPAPVEEASTGWGTSSPDDESDDLPL